MWLHLVPCAQVFSQEVIDPYGRVLDSSTGVVLFARPQMRWETQAPFPQTILLTHDRLQIYDPDLEQITQRSIDDNWQDIPLSVLLRADEQLEQVFAVSIPGVGEQADEREQQYRLTPKAPDGLFDHIDVRFSTQGFERIEIVDRIGQVTAIQFSDLQVVAGFAASLFELELPPGTDIVEG